MTPAQLEHLKLIDAHLERLLELAEKRTPGEWVKDYDNDTGKNDDSFWEWWEAGPARCEGVKGEQDAAFIASCAGNAEAGWRAARTAIAALSEIAKEKEPVEHGDSGDGPYTSMFRTSAAIFAKQQLESILAAFPVELIQKP